jgi:DNA-binding NtrC family response regulator
MDSKLSILIVDDESELRDSMRDLLQKLLSEYELQLHFGINGVEAIEIIQNIPVDLVLMDVKMPDMDGLTALEKIKSVRPETFVVIQTAHANVSDAIRAIREGAYDYLEKPIQVEKLKSILEKCLETRNLVADVTLSNPIMDDDIESDMIGHSNKMKDIFSLIQKLSKVDTTVLIRGENGTGKELVAKAIHYNSPRKSGPFIAINCGAIPENLIESELFGHEKGAFTGATQRRIGQFQSASNGTLFLDEIGELKPELQAKLLRVLQEKKFTPVGASREIKSNARIIAATNRNLEKMIQTGQFREDLFYRLNVLPIFLPPLRERKEDIPRLVEHFIRRFKKRHPKSLIEAVSESALKVLTQYDWPGNIRELENTIERAFIIESQSSIQLSSLPPALLNQKTQEKHSHLTFSNQLDYEAFKEQSEKEFIINALKANNGRINQTVANAGIPKNTLLRKMRKYGIQAKDTGGSE